MSSKERTQKYRERLNADHARREEVLRERRKKSKEIMPVHTEQTPTIGKDECLSHNLHSVTSTQDTIIKMVKLK